MRDIIPFRATLTQLVPNWKAAVAVGCIPGSGIPYSGTVALVMTDEKALLVSIEREILLQLHYQSIIRVRDTEFKGLVLVRDDVLVAPNETFGVEITYKGAGTFERTVKFFTQTANNARNIVDALTQGITAYLDETAMRGGIIRRDD